MEASAGQTPSGSRPRPPPSHRANSLSSTHTSSSRMASRSNNSSSSNLTSSPKQKSSNLSHRYHPARMSTSSSIDGPRLSLAKESSDGSQRSESRQSNGVTSSYLQEKLQLERKLDSQRSVSRMGDHMTSSLELRPIQSSPARRLSNNDARRPRSSGGSSGDPVKKKSLGLKEAETVRCLYNPCCQSFLYLTANVFTGHGNPTQTELRPETRTLLPTRKANCIGGTNGDTGRRKARAGRHE